MPEVRSTTSPVSPTLRITLWVLIVLFLLILVGSVLFKIEVVATGRGRIVPVTRVQSIQSQFKGKIVGIHVREGEKVAAGDLLVSLDDTEARSLVDQLRANLHGLEQERIIANAVVVALSQTDPASKDFLDAGLVGVASAPGPQSPETLAFVRSILVAISDDVAQLDSEVRKLELSERVGEARLENAAATSRIVAEKFSSFDTLKKQGVISRSDYLDQLRERTIVDGELAVAERALQQLAAEKEEVRRRRQTIISSGLVNYRKQAKDAANAIARTSAELTAAERNLSNMRLLSPVNGVVENLAVSTIGGFIEEGTSVMSVVPEGSKLEVEAFFENRDIGFLHRGQSAYVKLTAFPAERFGALKAEVTGVGTDARQDAVGQQWVYAVRLDLEKAFVDVDGRPEALTPGMTAAVDIVTGQRRLISYFFAPLIKTFQDSLRER